MKKPKEIEKIQNCSFRVDADIISKVPQWIKFLIKIKHEITILKKDDNGYTITVYNKYGGVFLNISKYRNNARIKDGKRK